MSGSPLLDAAGRRRSPATMPGYLTGRASRNKGMRCPADPPRPGEIIRVMRQAGSDCHGLRVRALVVVLWRGGLRISEALALTETDVDECRGSVLVRHGKGDKRREAGMDAWGFEHLSHWTAQRVTLPVGPLFCVIDGRPAGVGGRRLPHGASCVSSPLTPGSGADLRHISSAMLTRSSSRVMALRST